jgi:hypothetical protein
MTSDLCAAWVQEMKWLLGSPKGIYRLDFVRRYSTVPHILKLSGMLNKSVPSSLQE